MILGSSGFMTTIAIFLVLLSALFHALWNYVAKRVDGGALFVWFFSIFETIIFLPLALYALIQQNTPMPLQAWGFIGSSAIFHVLYYVLLVNGYRVGDLSIVYPLARGIGPLLATIGAIALFSERPTIVAMIGALFVCGGVIGLTGDPRQLTDKGALPGVSYAILTGIAIAAYTLWDSYAMGTVQISPIIYQSGTSSVRLMLLTPYALHNKDKLPPLRKNHWKAAVFIGAFGWLSYILILIAFRTSPVSYVAPLRVISTLIGVMFGAGLLKEGDIARRLSAATVMIIGVFAIGIG